MLDAQGIDFRPERPALASAGVAERTSFPMHTLLTTTVTLLKGWQRPLVIALCLLPLLVVTACCVPALLVLPFWPAGHTRATALVQHLREWSLALHGTDRPAPGR